MVIVSVHKKNISSELKNNFSERYYLARNHGYEVVLHGAIDHYIRFGEKTAARPVPYFSPNWWKATHGLDKGSFDTVFERFLSEHPDKPPSQEYIAIRNSCFRDDDEFSAIAGKSSRSRNGLIDFGFIQAQSGGVSAPDHLCLYMRLLGEGQYAAPSRIFDPHFYLTVNDDVRARGVDPLVHFLKAGVFENRKPCRFLRTRGDMSRFANTASFWNDVYSPAEIFEVEPPFELSRGDISAIGEGAVPHVASNWFLGEPQLLDNRDFARMLDVYQTYMGQRL